MPRVECFLNVMSHASGHGWKGKRKIKKKLSTDDGKRLKSIQWVHYWTISYQV